MRVEKLSLGVQFAGLHPVFDFLYPLIPEVNVDERLERNQGKACPEEAMALLEDVAQENTQWSVVYGTSTY